MAEATQSRTKPGLVLAGRPTTNQAQYSALLPGRSRHACRCELKGERICGWPPDPQNTCRCRQPVGSTKSGNSKRTSDLRPCRGAENTRQSWRPTVKRVGAQRPILGAGSQTRVRRSSGTNGVGFPHPTHSAEESVGLSLRTRQRNPYSGLEVRLVSRSAVIANHLWGRSEGYLPSSCPANGQACRKQSAERPILRVGS